MVFHLISHAIQPACPPFPSILGKNRSRTIISFHEENEPKIQSCTVGCEIKPMTDVWLFPDNRNTLYPVSKRNCVSVTIRHEAGTHSADSRPAPPRGTSSLPCTREIFDWRDFVCSRPVRVSGPHFVGSVGHCVWVVQTLKDCLGQLWSSQTTD